LSGGQKRERSATLWAAPGGTLPAECLHGQNWCWEVAAVGSSPTYGSPVPSGHYCPRGAGLKRCSALQDRHPDAGIYWHPFCSDMGKVYQGIGAHCAGITGSRGKSFSYFQ